MKNLPLLLMVLLSMGCVQKHGLVYEPYPEVQPIEMYPTTPDIRAPGSLYGSSNTGLNLISDAIAYRVNDIVLIAISESLSATNSATTDTSRESSASFKVPNLFGLEKTHTQFFGAGSSDGTVLGTSTNSEHEGKGSTGRSDVFTGSVAARVVNVLPNGYLMLQGIKTVHLNGEKTKIYLTGMVNPLMIDSSHSVVSTQVADLMVRYGGQGVVTAKQNPGLFSRIIQMIWPF